jgi:hypothetical protein
LLLKSIKRHFIGLGGEPIGRGDCGFAGGIAKSRAKPGLILRSVTHP